jgi:hypothetical protein
VSILDTLLTPLVVCHSSAQYFKRKKLTEKSAEKMSILGEIPKASPLKWQK